MSYQPKTYRKDGGDTSVVASGGVLDIESGGALKLAGVAITPTAAEINKLASVGAVVSSGTQQAHLADASVAHALNTTFSDTEVEAALDALGGKINSILTAIEAFKITATS